METHLTPTFYGCLCIGVIACALIMPQGLAAVDRLLAGQPERFDLDNWGDGNRYVDEIQPAIWPRVVTAIGGALLFAALLTLMFLCQQLAP
ncbi:hypothetical protein [Burkholderia sp. PAMC 28687]|jgi:hypothetical protein|uniref:hypothetical protein n=1 Tax=Burkholderia sp. PAMC 28687 TaxID=1795874 RepID=UPI0007801CCE|nr:hypothetical protein [Burkholderia sp. PAMC 28687]AMM14455.1 hypothetical protein AX768_10435 [Burkholderia sp. PAMC 28687]